MSIDIKLQTKEDSSGNQEQYLVLRKDNGKVPLDLLVEFHFEKTRCDLEDAMEIMKKWRDELESIS